MTTAAFALQRAVFDRLVADTELQALLGGADVFDYVPRAAPFPYVSFGPSIERDAATGERAASEHELVLHVWSRARGRREADGIAARLRMVLHEADFALDGHRLANLRHVSTETRRQPDGETLRGLVRFRAVTEPLAA